MTIPTDEINDKITHLEKRLTLLRTLQIGLWGLILLCPILGVLVFWQALTPPHTNQDIPAMILVPVYFLIFIAVQYIIGSQIREMEASKDGLEFQRDLENLDEAHIQVRAEKLLRLNELELRRYYDLNIRQNRGVFVLGTACIILGVGIVGISLYLVTAIDMEKQTQIITAALGGIGAILSNYVRPSTLR
jgi:hypothetical protein